MAAAQILQTYDMNHFNIIPYLHDISKSFQVKSGPYFVEKAFGPTVLKHKFESQMGIGLLHRHFDLKGFKNFSNSASPPHGLSKERTIWVARFFRVHGP